jgi:hypothetical protein
MCEKSRQATFLLREKKWLLPALDIPPDAPVSAGYAESGEAQ